MSLQAGEKLLHTGKRTFGRERARTVWLYSPAANREPLLKIYSAGQSHLVGQRELRQNVLIVGVGVLQLRVGLL